MPDKWKDDISRTVYKGAVSFTPNTYSDIPSAPYSLSLGNLR